MNIRLILLLLLFFLPSPQSNGQISDLSLLGLDTNEFLNSKSTEDEAEEEIERLEEENAKLFDKNAELESLKDSNYGYSGGETFNSPPISKISDEPLEYFGYSYFLGASRSYFSQANIPVPPNYLIGPNDTIKIILYGNKNGTFELKVSRDGNIFFPEIGPLSVAGLTFSDMEDVIKTAIASQLIGTQMSLTMGSLRTIDVFIMGAANNPGMYSISALSSITNAIFESGGVDVSGSLRNIKLKRQGETIANFDLYQLFLNGDTSSDIRLMQGDVIFIEPIGKTAGIRGEVNRPAIYELQESETIGDLLRFAGNLKPKANLLNAELSRINQSRNLFELTRIDLESDEGININNGDIVTIYPINDKIQNAVLVKGHTPQPGFYPWNKEMRILDLFRNSDDLLNMTDLNYVLIKRINKLNQRYFFRQADLQKAFEDPSSRDNIVLYDKDEILLLPSLISADLITTKLIKERNSNDMEGYENEITTSTEEEEWTSLTYLRRSIENTIYNMNDDGIGPSSQSNNKGEEFYPDYYEYSVYDYCNVPKNLVFKLKDDTAKGENKKAGDDIAKAITDECRKQLLDPMLSIAKRDNSSDKLSTISIFGGVHFPGTYPYTKGMRLSDAIKASGGALDGVFDSEVEFIRRDNIGNKFLSTGSFASMNEADKALLSKMDIVTVKKLTNDIRTVELSGEVHFPGVYPISENQTLSELISRAGGLTVNGDPDAAVFLREELREKERRNIETATSDLQRKIVLASTSTGVGQTALNNSQIGQLSSILQPSEAELKSLGRLVIDLGSVINSSSYDLKLEDGDKLHIPKEKQTISVIGEVFVPNSHIFNTTLGISDYVKFSGGYTEFADDSAIYLIKSNGSIVSPSELSAGFFRKDESIEPGDTIVVPLKVQSFNQLQAATEITQIIYQMALAAAAVNSF